MATKRVLIIVAHQGYQQVEYSVPKKLLEQAGVTVVTASNGLGEAVAKDGSAAPVDLLVETVDSNEYDGCIFVGGPGALEHLDNQTSYELIQKMSEKKKIIGAICIATRILAKAGVLHKRQATGWDGDSQLAELYREHGVYYAKQDVVVDDYIITATGPSAAREFAERVIAALHID
jgi:protease I